MLFPLIRHYSLCSATAENAQQPPATRKTKRNQNSTASGTLPAGSQTGLCFLCNLKEDVFNPRKWALNSELVISANLLSVSLKGKWRELMVLCGSYTEESTEHSFEAIKTKQIKTARVRFCVLLQFQWDKFPPVPSLTICRNVKIQFLELWKNMCWRNLRLPGSSSLQSETLLRNFVQMWFKTCLLKPLSFMENHCLPF
ncbi:unnamed protein product [Arabidopsis thaliana]|uniref:(thale cress) hypothetical protein n=1 Tax=Arabidopsis thaliana TaxID=3702 RepID=A0A7G2DUU2_ARATH|nr:unnamed protein product [Arabidopsis thaliana]